MKRSGLLLILLILSCGFVSFFGTVQAQSKPTVPTFTVKLVDNSYDTPPTQTTDPYTGTKTIPGYRIEKIEIEITIKNQNYPTKIMYNVRTKGHYEQNWQDKYSANSKEYPEQTHGQYTVLTFHTENYPNGAQVDIQVAAMSGTFSLEQDPLGVGVPDGGKKWVFYGVTSDWSKTQTLNINKNSNGITNQQTDNSETPSDPNQQIGFSYIELSIIVTISVIITIAATLLILKKTVNIKTFNDIQDI